MRVEDLKFGVHPVKHKDESGEIIFNLSVIEAIGGIKGVCSLSNKRRPKNAKHLMLTNTVRDWIGRMEYI